MTADEFTRTPRTADSFSLARLEANARHYQPDPQLDRAVELFYSDRAAWNALPAQLRSLTPIYETFRQQYRDAVRAGVVPADRGSAA